MASLSYRKVVIPAVSGSQKVNMEVDVIDADIPLLMSKAATKKAETVLNVWRTTSIIENIIQTHCHSNIKVKKNQRVRK